MQLFPPSAITAAMAARASDTYGRRTDPMADSDPQKFEDDNKLRSDAARYSLLSFVSDVMCAAFQFEIFFVNLMS